MAFVILVLMAFFAMIALQQQMTKKGVEAGAKDSEIKMILSYYKILREHQSETKANASRPCPAWYSGGEQRGPHIVLERSK